VPENRFDFCITPMDQNFVPKQVQGKSPPKFFGVRNFFVGSISFLTIMLA
jgi:hypothetical protein